jgi:hypothetical protein
MTHSGSSEPIQKAEDPGRNGIFNDGEVEEFLADLSAMRRSEVVCKMRRVILDTEPFPTWPTGWDATPTSSLSARTA